MIVLSLSLNNVYGFENFEINFSYPKKVVNSIIAAEHLRERDRFRYKKAVILMGTNATGKTSMGKALLKITNYINTSNTAVLFEMVSDVQGSFSIDFVNGGFKLHRLSAVIDVNNSTVEINYSSADIDKMDSYEMCVDKLIDRTAEATRSIYALREIVGPVKARFAYPQIETSLMLNDIDKSVFLKTLHAVIGTLDPSLRDISFSRDLKDTIVIRRKKTELIIQQGKLLNQGILSSGTAEGIDVALFLASMLSKENTFYYCDEHFSYIQSDIQKRIFGLMLERISDDEQLIFTTHNTDMLDLNLPKHSFMFLRKRYQDGRSFVEAVSASDILKRSTDSIRNAVENDVFGSLPDDSLLDELEMGWENA